MRRKVNRRRRRMVIEQQQPGESYTETLRRIFTPPQRSDQRTSSTPPAGDVLDQVYTDLADALKHTRQAFPGQFRVKTTIDLHVDLVLEFTSALICHTALTDPDSWTRAWRYDDGDLIRSVRQARDAALEWDGTAESEPTGWVRALHDQRRRSDGGPTGEHSLE